MVLVLKKHFTTTKVTEVTVPEEQIKEIVLEKLGFTKHSDQIMVVVDKGEFTLQISREEVSTETQPWLIGDHDD